MKGDAKVIEALNRAHTAELTAINPYFVQGKMLKHSGYLNLAKKTHEDSIGEMKHAARITGGFPPALGPHCRTGVARQAGTPVSAPCRQLRHSGGSGPL